MKRKFSAQFKFFIIAGTLPVLTLYSLDVRSQIQPEQKTPAASVPASKATTHASPSTKPGIGDIQKADGSQSGETVAALRDITAYLKSIHANSGH